MRHPYYLEGEQLLLTPEVGDIYVIVSNNLSLAAQFTKAAETAGAVPDS
jgi:hypothetical protein